MRREKFGHRDRDTHGEKQHVKTPTLKEPRPHEDGTEIGLRHLGREAKNCQLVLRS